MTAMICPLVETPIALATPMVVRTASAPDDFLGIAAPLCPTEQFAAALVELVSAAVRAAVEAEAGVPAAAWDWAVTISTAIRPVRTISPTHRCPGAIVGLNVTAILCDLFVKFRHRRLPCEPAHRAR